MWTRRALLSATPDCISYLLKHSALDTASSIQVQQVSDPTQAGLHPTPSPSPISGHPGPRLAPSTLRPDLSPQCSRSQAQRWSRLTLMTERGNTSQPWAGGNLINLRVSRTTDGNLLTPRRLRRHNYSSTEKAFSKIRKHADSSTHRNC